MNFFWLLLVFCIGCGTGKSESALTQDACGSQCDVTTSAPGAETEPSGIQKVLLDRPNQLNEFSLKLSWPKKSGVSEYRVIRTLLRGGRVSQHPLISTVSTNRIEDTDLVGGSILIYRIEGLSKDEATINVGETKVQVPLDVRWSGNVHVDEIYAITKDHILNRVFFEKGTKVSVKEKTLSLDAQAIVFQETSFVTFEPGAAPGVAPTSPVFGAQGNDGTPGRSGGFIRIRAKSLRGTVNFFLSGENGGQGGSGFGGAPGNNGGGGDIGCTQRRGTDGAPGGNGGRGGNGGSLGKLYLEANDVQGFVHTINGSPGQGGAGGSPGAGGNRGVGKTLYCGVGFLAAPLAGYAGNNGPAGAPGATGLPGGKGLWCLVLGKNVSEDQAGSCNLIHSQTSGK
ncbi:MAG: hypothetical protein K2X47_00185 [Bdellovibrionales bacterium]|nr:hypothetical protein [Bdellovibrionales bacterium]